DVVCTDKTGTLTTNRLKLDQIRVLAPDLGEEEVRLRLRLFASASIDQNNKNIQALRAALGEACVEVVDQLPFKSENRARGVRGRARRGDGGVRGPARPPQGSECRRLGGAVEAVAHDRLAHPDVRGEPAHGAAGGYARRLRAGAAGAGGAERRAAARGGRGA